MAHGTFTTRVLVVKKTKLGESDVIVTLLDADGSLLRAVAHGARKPKNPFSSRLDLFSECDVLLAHGKNLDIVSEARLIKGFDTIKQDILRVSALEPILEALGKTTQENLPVTHLFDMTISALCHANHAVADISPRICAAFLLKLFAFLGIVPSFTTCVTCGKPVPLGGTTLGPGSHGASLATLNEHDTSVQRFSMSGGGIVCDQCSLSEPTRAIQTQTLLWSHTLLHMTFDQVVQCRCTVNRSFDILKFCSLWLQANLQVRLKSLDFLFQSGLF